MQRFLIGLTFAMISSLVYAGGVCNKSIDVKLLPNGIQKAELYGITKTHTSRSLGTYNSYRCYLKITNNNKPILTQMVGYTNSLDNFPMSANIKLMKMNGVDVLYVRFSRGVNNSSKAKEDIYYLYTYRKNKLRPMFSFLLNSTATDCGDRQKQTANFLPDGKIVIKDTYIRHIAGHCFRRRWGTEKVHTYIFKVVTKYNVVMPVDLQSVRWAWKQEQHKAPYFHMSGVEIRRW